MLAESVEKLAGPQEAYVVTVAEGQGILDGGHTYELIENHLKIGDLPDDQFVKVEILTNVPREWTTEIAGGLNTSVQVQAMSLDNQQGQFNWIKEEIAAEPYASQIAWMENAPGEFDARDIVAILTAFNIGEFPNDLDDHPIEAYEKKSNALKRFEDNPETYKKMLPILKDILQLHDIVRKGSRELWNVESGKFGNLKFVETK